MSDSNESAGWVDDLPEGAGLQADGSFVLPLQKPVELGQRTITELRLRAPKGKDYRSAPMNLEGASFNVMMEFGARLAGEIPRVIDELGPIDVVRFVEIANHFFAGAPEGIGTSSSVSSPVTSAGG